MRMLAYRSLSTLLLILLTVPVFAGEARQRWERMNQIRQDKFDLVLPEVMRENDIDMWIVMRREGYDDPLTPDLGGGYVGTTGFYVFTDRGGDRIERAALGISGYLIEVGGGYDIFAGEDTTSSLMTFLLLRVSGVTLLERSLKETKPQYAEYVRRTSAFVLWPPKD